MKTLFSILKNNIFQIAAQTKTGPQHKEKEALATQEEAHNYKLGGRDRNLKKQYFCLML